MTALAWILAFFFFCLYLLKRYECEEEYKLNEQLGEAVYGKDRDILEPPEIDFGDFDDAGQRR